MSENREHRPNKPRTMAVQLKPCFDLHNAVPHLRFSIVLSLEAHPQLVRMKFDSTGKQIRNEHELLI